jgi:hypothetical protein
MSSSEALAVIGHQDAAQALMPALSVEQAVARYEAVVKFVKSIMREGVDFGTIQGTDKPSLWKAGAEKLTTFFGLSKRFLLIEKVEDWSGLEHGGEAFFYYSYRCALYNGDMLIAESDGSCNSFESKYRWRKADRVCPLCGAAAILKSKFDDGGWFCFKKKDGCGANFTAGDPDIERQQVGRIPNPDVCDLVNTIQKMAQKRAFVAAALLGVNASEFFTQDIEDLVVDAFDGEDRSPAPAQRKATNQPPRPAAQSSQSNGKSPEEKAIDEALMAHCVKEKGNANAAAYFKAMYGSKSLEQKREAAKTLGLTVAAPATPAAPAAPVPQPVTPPPADVVEGELIEEAPAELSPARLEIENLCDQLHALGCPFEHINAKIAQIAGGVYASNEIKEDDLPKVRLSLSRYVEMGDRAAAEMAKEFKPKGGK